MSVCRTIFGLLTEDLYQRFRQAAEEKRASRAHSTPVILENSMREDDMRARLILQMIDDDGEAIATETVADLVKVTKGAEDLGLSLSEAKSLLAKLQQVMVETQVELWLSENRELDGRRLRSKGSYPVTLHTLFGDVRLKSPRYFLPRTGGTNSPSTVSPLRTLIPDHIAPERLYLEARWASLVPYAAAAELLADVLPVQSGANATTVRQHALRTARRIERELTEERVSFMQDACPRDWMNAHSRWPHRHRPGWRLHPRPQRPEEEFRADRRPLAA